MPRRTNDDSGALPNAREVGCRLVAIREAIFLKRSEIADELRCDRPTWSKYEAAERDLTLAVAWRIHCLYGLTLDYVFAGRSYGIPEQYRSAVIARLNELQDHS